MEEASPISNFEKRFISDYNSVFGAFSIAKDGFAFDENSDPLIQLLSAYKMECFTFFMDENQRLRQEIRRLSGDRFSFCFNKYLFDAAIVSGNEINKTAAADWWRVKFKLENGDGITGEMHLPSVNSKDAIILYCETLFKSNK